MPHLRKYVSIAKASLEVIFVYRAGFALNMIGTVFYVVAMFYLWQTIFLGSPGALGGFTWPEMKAYLLVAFLLNSLMTWYDEWVMGRDVREGLVAVDLARPIDFQAKRFAEAMGPIPFELCSAWWSGPWSSSCSVELPCRPIRRIWGCSRSAPPWRHS